MKLLPVGLMLFCISTDSLSQKSRSDINLKFLDEYIIPFNYSFQKTTVGGLSGIDYDPENKIYYTISDDRSVINPARFYTIDIRVKNDLIDTVLITGKTFLKNREGKNFPSSSNGKPAVDPESIRLWNNKIIWSSEGQRTIAPGETMLRNPEIFIADKSGAYLDTFDLPEQLRVSSAKTGVRNNGGFEGLSLSADGRYLFASVEEPLLQDGDRAGLGDSTGIVRIIKYNLSTKKAVAQYAYEIEAVAHPVFPPSAFRLNGISEILAVNDSQLLIVERSFSTGRLSCTIKVFIADLSEADDISHLHSLKGAAYKKAPKKLVLNMDDLGRFVDNIEGVTFGPELSNGKRSLIFIADNNFIPLEKNQIFLFEFSEE